MIEILAIGDEVLRDAPLVGSVDQFVDSTDVLGVAGRVRQVLPERWHPR